MPSAVKRSMNACQRLSSSASACAKRSCSTSRCSASPFGFRGAARFATTLRGFPARLAISGARGQVLEPGPELGAHRHLAAAVQGAGHRALLAVAAVVAVKAHPVAAARGEAPLALLPVLEVVRVHERRGRVDEVVVPERAPV